MDKLKQTAEKVVDQTGDTIAAIMLTVVVAVLFVQQHAVSLQPYKTELLLIIGSVVLVHLVAPAISSDKTHRHLYILGFAHLAWSLLVSLSGANDSLSVLINLGLIGATAVWLPYIYTIISVIVLSFLYGFNVEAITATEIFVLTSYLAFGLFLIERSLSDRSKRQAQYSQLTEATVERQRMQALINSMTDGVIATDDNGSVVLYNGSALDLLNINVSLERKNIKDFMFLFDSQDKKVDVYAQAEKARAYFVSRDLRLKIDEDELLNVFISMSPVRIGFGAKGEQGFVILLRDITKEKSLEEERDEFISVVSHELRTPITIAEGNISNLKLLVNNSNLELDETIKTAIGDAYKQIVFLSDMINDLATLSRAERGKLQTDPETIDTADLAESICRDYQKDAEQKGLKLELDIDKSAANIYSSRLYVREVLQNFITNAIKYTAEGSVTLRLLPKDSESVIFEVEDTGIGISRSDQKKLFQKFFRSEDYRTRENNGTGLGLYVTLKLAKIIGAIIDVESELNRGSTFRITIPSIEDKKRNKTKV